MKGLVPVYAALVAGAHFAGGGSGGGGVGAFVLERVCREYDATRKKLEEEEGREDEEEEGEEERLARELDNLVLILGYLYAFGLVACGLVYDLIRELVVKLGERDVELLLLLLRTAGHQLRGDDPAALKDIVLAVQERAEEVMEGGREGGGGFSARVRHMLETINDLKNNKKRQAQLQELDRTQRLKKVVQRARSSSSSSSSSSSGRKGGGETLHLTWADIRASDERGRWWRVGASWVGKQTHNQDEKEEEQERKSSGSSSSSRRSATETTLQAKITKLAAKQRMNTDVRRAIFASVMTASDYQDAFERLMRLNLTDQQEREVVRVLIDCAGQEKGYNPFYAYLAGRLCEYHDKYKFTLQLTYWDVFKLLDEEGAGFAPPPPAVAAPAAKKGAAAAAAAAALSPQHRRAINLAKTLCHLIVKGWLSLSVLKVVDVAGLGEGGGVFFRAFFAEFLDEESCPDSEVLGAVQRVGSSKDPLTLTETLTAFLHRYTLNGGGEGGGGGEEGKKRKKRAKSVVKLLEKLSVSQFMGGGGGGGEGGRRGRRGEGDDDGWDGM
jgi:nucleolar MIF4G domain-containing protein 1